MRQMRAPSRAFKTAVAEQIVRAVSTAFKAGFIVFNAEGGDWQSIPVAVVPLFEDERSGVVVGRDVCGGQDPGATTARSCCERWGCWKANRAKSWWGRDLWGGRDPIATTRKTKTVMQAYFFRKRTSVQLLMGCLRSAHLVDAGGSREEGLVVPVVRWVCRGSCSVRLVGPAVSVSIAKTVGYASKQ
jgi:hypothetical protein